jgi:hypothetical protein
MNSKIIEIVTFRLKDGGAEEQFLPCGVPAKENSCRV